MSRKQARCVRANWGDFHEIRRRVEDVAFVSRLPSKATGSKGLY